MLPKSHAKSQLPILFKQLELGPSSCHDAHSLALYNHQVRHATQHGGAAAIARARPAFHMPLSPWSLHGLTLS